MIVNMKWKVGKEKRTRTRRRQRLKGVYVKKMIRLMNLEKRLMREWNGTEKVTYGK